MFLRSLDDPSLSKQYTTHTAQTTVARFSPSGFYVASGDVSGAVKVWDAVEGVNTKGMTSISECNAGAKTIGRRIPHYIRSNK